MADDESIYGQKKLKRISENLSLPSWWVESVCVEYFDCRRYAEGGELWTFDFGKVGANDIKEIPEKKVVIPNYFLLQNIRPRDLAARTAMMMVGLPAVPLDQADLIPEGLVNNTGFPMLGNSINVWDHKLGFSERVVVLDDGVFYQWKISQFYPIPGKHFGWWKSELFDLMPLFTINQKLQDYRNSGELKKPNKELVARISRDYQALEEIRKPLREKILEYHNSKKTNYDVVDAVVPEPPMLSIFESVKLVNNPASTAATQSNIGYFVKTHMEPLFLRSAIRNYQQAKVARAKRDKSPDDQACLLDEMEHSAMCMIAATSCLESYINFIIATYLPEESKVFDDSTSHRQKWLWVPAALNLPKRFNPGEVPFSDFSNVVKWRNNAIHHVAEYTRARDQRSHTYNQFNVENAETALKTVKQMVTFLSQGSAIPLPRWLSTDVGSAEFWDEVSSFLKQ